jgi:hypothetical protein
VVPEPVGFILRRLGLDGVKRARKMTLNDEQKKVSKEEAVTIS